MIHKLDILDMIDKLDKLNVLDVLDVLDIPDCEGGTELIPFNYCDWLTDKLKK